MYDHRTNAMDDKPTQDLATRAFQKRVLDEFASLRAELRAEAGGLRNECGDLRAGLGDLRTELGQLRAGVAELRTQQTVMAGVITAIDQRLATLEQCVDERLKETRPLWETVQVQLQRLTDKLDGVLLEFYELRGEFKIHGRRIGELERRVLS